MSSACGVITARLIRVRLRAEAGNDAGIEHERRRGTCPVEVR